MVVREIMVKPLIMRIKEAISDVSEEDIREMLTALDKNSIPRKLEEISRGLESKGILKSVIDIRDDVLDDTLPTEPILRILKDVLTFLRTDEPKTYVIVDMLGTGKSHLLAFTREAFELIKMGKAHRIRSRLEERRESLSKVSTDEEKLNKFYRDTLESVEEILEEIKRKDVRASIEIVVIPKEEVIKGDAIYDVILEKLGLGKARDHIEASEMIRKRALKEPIVILIDEIQKRYAEGKSVDKDREFLKELGSIKGVFAIIAGNTLPGNEKVNEVLKSLQAASERHRLSLRPRTELRKILALAYLQNELLPGALKPLDVTSLEAFEHMISEGESENILRNRIRLGLVRLALYLLSDKMPKEVKLFSGLYPVDAIRHLNKRRHTIHIALSEAFTTIELALNNTKVYRDALRRNKFDAYLARAILKALVLSLSEKFPKSVVDSRIGEHKRAYEIAKASGMIAEAGGYVMLTPIWVTLDGKLRRIFVDDPRKAGAFLLYRFTEEIKTESVEDARKYLENRAKEALKRKASKEGYDVIFTDEPKNLVKVKIEVDADGILEEIRNRAKVILEDRIRGKGREKRLESPRPLRFEDLEGEMNRAIKGFVENDDNILQYVYVYTPKGRFAVHEYLNALNENTRNIEEETRNILSSLNPGSYSVEDIRKRVMSKLKLNIEEVPLSVLNIALRKAAKEMEDIDFEGGLVMKRELDYKKDMRIELSGVIRTIKKGRTTISSVKSRIEDIIRKYRGKVDDPISIVKEFLEENRDLLEDYFVRIKGERTRVYPLYDVLLKAIKGERVGRGKIYSREELRSTIIGEVSKEVLQELKREFKERPCVNKAYVEELIKERLSRIEGPKGIIPSVEMVISEILSRHDVVDQGMEICSKSALAKKPEAAPAVANVVKPQVKAKVTITMGSKRILISGDEELVRDFVEGIKRKAKELGLEVKEI